MRSVCLHQPGRRNRLVAELLRCPGRGGMVGDGHVHHASALMRHEDEEEAVRRGRDDGQIRCHNLADVICEECSPHLGPWVRRRAMYFATVP